MEELTPQVELTLSLDSMDEQIKLFGAFDENLRVLEAETGAHITVTADGVSCKGDEQSAKLAYEIIEKA